MKTKGLFHSRTDQNETAIFGSNCLVSEAFIDRDGLEIEILTVKRMAWIAVSMDMARLFAAFTAIFIGLSTAWSADPIRCERALLDSHLVVSSENAFKENFKTNNQPVANRQKYFKDIAWLIQQNLPEIRKELSKINNELGSDIEVSQTFSFLNNVDKFEASSLGKIKTIDNAVIYGSTNVPLYTLVTQGFLVGSFSRNVWIRTPEATREVYLNIFKLLKDYLPRNYTDNIHLVSDPSDLSYDVFNRIFVMGQSRNGNRSVRPPSELVVLTGNPDTARGMIDRNIRNLEKLSYSYEGRQQLFLGFLAGVNPAIVVPSAKRNMKEVVDNLVFPFLVNGGQDCMNSDVVFAHAEALPMLKAELLNKFSQLKATTNGDREWGITPVTMSKNFDKLIAYREKYKKYLVTPEATIDPVAKRVAPHVFVIPFSEFKNLDIQEHFAPFMTIVKYETRAQLEQASLDPRMQRKSMYALVYGDSKMSSDLDQARDVFRQAQHSVLTNTHLYQEFEMNMPFGGAGTDTSMSALVKMEGAGQVTVQNRNRPMLISKETEDAFSPTKPIQAKSKAPQAEFSDLQKEAQENGLYIVKDNPYYSNRSGEAQKLYGIKFVIPSEAGPVKKIKGVVLHQTDVHHVGEDPRVLGAKNPLNGDLNTLRKYRNSKLAEFELTRRIQPELMPGVKRLSEVLTEAETKSFDSERNDLVIRLKGLRKESTDLEFKSLELSVYNFVNRWLSVIRSKYPEGAYVKNYGEFASGDLGNSVTTFAASPLQITREFIHYVREANHRYQNEKFGDEKFLNVLTLGMTANGSRFVTKALINPEVILVQPRLPMAQTHLGSPMEFRVDFIAGKPVASRMRFGYEYYPDQMQKSMDVITEFMANAPENVRTLSGGADVGFTKEGKPVVFEWNFGTASGTLYPEYYPFEANQIFSTLLGKDTWFLSYAKSISSKSPAEQNEFIRSRKNEKQIWWKSSVDEISQVEWARWLRDQMLDQWRNSADKKSTVEELRARLQLLLENQGTGGSLDFQRLRETSEHFIQSELAKP